MTAELLQESELLAVLLGDIGVFAFRNELSRFPDRVLNFGIMEQSKVSFAAGLSKAGFYPVMHSIAPFLVERALEQIKVDFGYQGLRGNFVSVGASFDYAALGGTHHSPGDVLALLSVPGCEIFLPGHPEELEHQIRAHFFDDKISYFRLSENSNSSGRLLAGERSELIVRGSSGSILAIGPVLDVVIEAADSRFSIVYINELSSGAVDDALALLDDDRIMIVEPYFERTTAVVMADRHFHERRICFRGIPKRFFHSYGSFEDQMDESGLSPQGLRDALDGFFGG